jgi:hypothetical protein
LKVVGVPLCVFSCRSMAYGDLQTRIVRKILLWICFDDSEDAIDPMCYVSRTYHETSVWSRRQRTYWLHGSRIPDRDEIRERTHQRPYSARNVFQGQESSPGTSCCLLNLRSGEYWYYSYDSVSVDRFVPWCSWSTEVRLSDEAFLLNTVRGTPCKLCLSIITLVWVCLIYRMMY